MTIIQGESKPRETLEAAMPEHVTTDSTNCRVCVIEQDTAVSRGIQMLLRHLPAAVITYSSAESFLSNPPRESAIDCIIIEMNLPGMSGLQLLSEIRAEGITAPAIILSSKSDVATAVAAMRAGAYDFIEKPFLHGALLDRVRQALRMSGVARA